MKDNKFLQALLGLLCVVLVVFIAAKTRNTFAERDYIGKVVQDRDLITVSGEGKVTSKPDLAKLDLGVMTEGMSVKEVQAKNTEKMNAIIAALKTLGVEEKDIQTSNYSIYPKYDYTDGRQRIVGYQVSQSVSVKVRDLDKAGDVLAKAGELGANQVGGIQFTVDDPTSLQAEARIKAIGDARKKAKALADELGLTIVKVVTFSESGGAQPPYPMAYAARADMGMEKAVAPDIEPGSLDVTSNVSVTFEVR